LPSCLELCEVLVEISVNLINVSIVLDHILRELPKVRSEGSDCGISPPWADHSP
jgi:hypothetical protein